MNPLDNPYSPTAGWPPAEFAGREDLIAGADIALGRTLKGRQANGLILRGLRGVGKTVLLNHIRDMAEAKGFETVQFEVPDPKGGHLIARMVPLLSAVLIRLSRRAKAQALVTRARAALQNLAALFKVRYEGISVGIDPASPEAMSGQLEIDLPETLRRVAEAAQADGRGLALFIDEIQYLDKEELSALSLAAHQLGQRQLPFLLIGSGLPQISARMADAKSYSERLFDFPMLGPLQPEAARRVLEHPAAAEGVSFTTGALDRILSETQGYPYFLQTWGKFSWNAAPVSPITETDVDAANAAIIAYLDENFFRVRYDRCSDAERRYLRGLAELGDGAHATGTIAETLRATSQQTARVRANLIDLGMVYAPQYGETAFTVPLFDAFMKRVMPELEPYRLERTRT